MPTLNNVKITLLLMAFIVLVIASSCRKTASAANEPNPVVLQPMMGEGTNVSVYAYVPYISPETTYVSTLPDTINFNTDSVLTIKNYFFESGEAAAALLKFNNLPGAGKEIDSAVLYLYGLDSAAFATNPQVYNYGNTLYPAGTKKDSITVQQVTGNWYSNKVTWLTQPTVIPAGIATIAPPTAKWGYNVAINITGMVNTWINSPEQNYGVKLAYLSSLGLSPYPSQLQRVQFYSSYTANAALRPKLVITYK